MREATELSQVKAGKTCVSSVSSNRVALVKAIALLDAATLVSYSQ